MTGQHSERETRGSTVLNGMSLNSSPQSSGIHMEEEKGSVKSRGSEQLQGNSIFQSQHEGCTYEHSKTCACDSMYRTCTSSSQLKSQHGEGEVSTKSHPNQEAIGN